MVKGALNAALYIVVVGVVAVVVVVALFHVCSADQLRSVEIKKIGYESDYVPRCTRARAHTHTHTHTQTHKHPHVRTHTHAHTETCTRTHTHPHTHMHARIRTHTHMHAHAHMHARTHKHTHMNMHTYMHTQREKEKETCRKREKREVKYESYTFNMRPEIEVKKEGGGGGRHLFRQFTFNEKLDCQRDSADGQNTIDHSFCHFYVK